MRGCGAVGRRLRRKKAKAGVDAGSGSVRYRWRDGALSAAGGGFLARLLASLPFFLASLFLALLALLFAETLLFAPFLLARFESRLTFCLGFSEGFFLLLRFFSLGAKTLGTQITYLLNGNGLVGGRYHCISGHGERIRGEQRNRVGRKRWQRIHRLPCRRIGRLRYMRTIGGVRFMRYRYGAGGAGRLGWQ